MRKKIPKRYRYTKQATKRDEKRTEPAEPLIDTSGPLWGYSPTGRIILDELPQIYLCPICGGTGKRKAMQLAINAHGRIMRVSDKEVVCGLCNGSGKIK